MAHQDQTASCHYGIFAVCLQLWCKKEDYRGVSRATESYPGIVFFNSHTNKMKTNNRKLPEYFPESWADAYGQNDYGLWQSVYLGEVEIRFCWMPPGHFMMGSSVEEPGRFSNEGPQHEVIFKEGFWLAETACTQGLWKKVMGDNPSRFSEDLQNPVENVDGEMILTFMERLKSRIPGLVFRLPSEAEWEYGCRAGTTTPFWFGDSLSTDNANYDGNYPYNNDSKGKYRKRSLPVRSFARNPWGLYQMHGNVWELCQDSWHGTYDGAPTDGSAWEEGKNTVYRGGSWIGDGRILRSACRRLWHIADGDDGFRLALGPPPGVSSGEERRKR